MVERAFSRLIPEEDFSEKSFHHLPPIKQNKLIALYPQGRYPSISRACHSLHDACNQLTVANILAFTDDANGHLPPEKTAFFYAYCELFPFY